MSKEGIRSCGVALKCTSDTDFYSIVKTKCVFVTIGIHNSQLADPTVAQERAYVHYVQCYSTRRLNCLTSLSSWQRQCRNKRSFFYFVAVYRVKTHSEERYICYFAFFLICYSMVYVHLWFASLNCICWKSPHQKMRQDCCQCRVSWSVDGVFSVSTVV